MPSVEDTIRELVTTKKVVLFMKGSRQFPQCGFSAQVVQILSGLTSSYETVNVLSDPAMRDGIKRYSDWPTIPQLYVDGKFVGGCDIVKEMFSNGELAALLGADQGAKEITPLGASKMSPPAITLTPRAESAIAAARETPTDTLRMTVSRSFEHELYFDGPEANDVVVQCGGTTLRLDADSASRAHGVVIDFVDAGGGGFKIDNPNEPPRVRAMSAKALRAALDAKEALSLFDVRTDQERATTRIKEAVALDDEGQKRLGALPKESKVVFMCHHGMRSRVAAEAALRQGFTQVYNLEGGIDAWSTDVDPSVPKY